MKYVNLGRSGLKVSRLCLGCMSYGEPERLPQPWSLDEKASRPLIRQALEAGINFFDTANIYSGGSSEEGRWGDPLESDGTRQAHARLECHVPTNAKRCLCVKNV